MLKTIERIFGLRTLDAVAGVNDLSDMFEPGVLPEARVERRASAAGFA